MKKLTIAVLIAMMLCLAGCGAESNIQEDNSIRFESTINHDEGAVFSYDIIVDNETGFQYLVFNTGYYQSMTQMMGADGKPIMADGYSKPDYCPECGSAIVH